MQARSYFYPLKAQKYCVPILGDNQVLMIQNIKNI